MTVIHQHPASQDHKPQLRLLLSITNIEDESRVLEVFHAHHIPLCYEFRAKGTAPSEFLDILGLGNTSRVITVGYVQRRDVHEVFENINDALAYHRRGTGIAVTLPLTSVQGAVLSLLQSRSSASDSTVSDASASNTDTAIPNTNTDHTESEDSTMAEHHSNYSLIMIAVNAGYSNTVVGAARDAGARGGTVIHGRRSADSTLRELGFDGNEEQEFVMIILPEERRADVMQAIAQFCGLNTPAHGVVVSLPVDEVMGLA